MIVPGHRPKTLATATSHDNRNMHVGTPSGGAREGSLRLAFSYARPHGHSHPVVIAEGTVPRPIQQEAARLFEEVGNPAPQFRLPRHRSVMGDFPVDVRDVPGTVPDARAHLPGRQLIVLPEG